MVLPITHSSASTCDSHSSRIAACLACTAAFARAAGPELMMN